MERLRIYATNNQFNTVLITIALAIITGLSIGLHIVDAINASAITGIIITIVSTVISIWFAMRKILQAIEKWSVDMEEEW